MSIGGHSPLTWQIWHSDGTQYPNQCPECNDIQPRSMGQAATSTHEALKARMRAAIDDLYHMNDADVEDIADVLAQIHLEL